MQDSHIFLDRPHRRIGPRELAALLADWRPDGPSTPGYVALAERLRMLVLDGRLPVHTLLPSERTLAEAAGTSRTTTTAAYRRLREAGFASGRQGAGTWTTLPGAGAAAPWPVHPGDGTPGELPDLSTASFEAPPELYSAYSAALADLPRYLPGHGYATAGVSVLRERVAARYTERGLPTRAEEVLITAGATQALHLALEALVEKGDRVLVEHPTWPMAADAVRRAGGRPVALPVEDGWDPGQLAHLAARARPRLAYLMPDFHNPTGQLMPGPVRREVARGLADAGCLALIDETTAELDLREGLGLPAGPLPPPLAALARPGAMVCIGSASKTFWGGLRIGWVRAESALIARLTQLRAARDLAGPVLEQLTAVHLFDGMPQSLPRLRAEVARRCRTLLAALADQVPDWQAPVPAGGLALWVRLPQPRATALAAAARGYGLTVTPGPRFGVDGGFEARLRLPFTTPPDRLVEAVGLLARAWTGELPGLSADDSALVV